MAIRPPRRTGDYPDRDIDVQIAMSEIFTAAISAAEKAGWSKVEAARALAELSDNLILQAEADDITQALVDSMRATKQ